MANKNIQLSPHPFLLAKGIRIPQLKRRRRVWAFLPNDYFENTTRHYPVIYFNDGQNVFEGWKAPFGKGWDVQLTMQKYAQNNNNPHILIGIEHGKKYRMGEFLPFDKFNNLAFEGNAFSDFVANDLKEYVDKTLRTLPQREHNGIIGSSLGGLNALFIGCKHQDVFSKVGVLSPSLWAAPHIFSLIRQVGKHYPTKFYVSIGSKEGRYGIENVERLYSTLLSAGFRREDLKLHLQKEGKHNEILWRDEFSRFFNWIS